MYAVFNLIIIGLVLLIAYWWANQGLFSAILHLVCVVAAGAIALAIWEPLVTGLLLHNGFFDNYAWGVGLILPFVLILLGLRIIFDKSIGANVTLPRWADMSFGFVVGLMAGIITVGIFVIGSGFVHAGRAVMGYTGFARSSSGAAIGEQQSMWLPVHKLTSDFYSFLSVGALRPDFEGTPMQQYYPELYKAAVSLQRDSFDKGRGRTTLTGKDARVTRVLACDTCNPKRFSVEMEFETGARDYGEMLTLSASQVRLIGNATGFNKPKTAHPVAFSQWSGTHRFDDISHYISGEPGQQRAKAIMEFNIADLGTQTPRFIMVKGARFQLPRAGTAQWEALDPSAYRLAVGSTGGPLDKVEISPNGIDITESIRQGNDIRPIEVSINVMPAGVETITVSDKYYISGGDGEFLTVNPNRPGKGLGIAGILQPPGTSIVKVDVSRSSKANIFKDQLSLTAGTEDPSVMLVDSLGRPYLPIGYMWTQPGGRTRIRVSFDTAVDKISETEIPRLPTSDTHRLTLLFAVTNGSTIVGLKLGDAVVGTGTFYVDDPDKKKAQENQNNQGGFGAESAGG